MRKINEIGIGSFRPGREPQGRHIRSVDLMGPSSNADSVISQRMQYQAYTEEEENYEDDEEVILDCRVYKNGKYCLIETLERLVEFDYADKVNRMMAKLSSQKQKRSANVNNLPSAEQYVKSMAEESEIDDDESLEEFSGAAAVGERVYGGGERRGRERRAGPGPAGPGHLGPAGDRTR